MKLKVLASLICVVFVLTALAGCDMKLSNKNAASPSGSGAGSSASASVSTDASVIIGVVTTIDARSISLDIVVKSAADTAASPSGMAASGSPVYAKTGGSLTVAVAKGAPVILGNKGYTAGSFSDVKAGDFLVVTLTGNAVIALIDNGPFSGGSPGTDSAQPSGKPQTGTDATGTYLVSAADLNVRSGPAETEKILGKLIKGTKLTGTVTNGWLKFTFGSLTAYCNAQYVTAVPADSDGLPVGVPDSDQSATYTVTTEGLNVRNSQGSAGSILGKLSKGTKVTGSISGGWLKFTYNGQTAYCSAQYLSADATAGGAPAAASSSPTAASSSPAAASSSPAAGVPDSSTMASYTVAADDLNVRSAASTSSTVLGKLSKGTKVSGTVSGGWLKFSYSGQTGYCDARYLTAAG